MKIKIIDSGYYMSKRRTSGRLRQHSFFCTIRNGEVSFSNCHPLINNVVKKIFKTHSGSFSTLICRPTDCELKYFKCFLLGVPAKMCIEGYKSEIKNSK